MKGFELDDSLATAIPARSLVEPAAPATTLKPCIYCKEPIHLTASLCKHCNNYQSFFRNSAGTAFWSTVILAVAAFTGQQLLKTYNDYTAKTIVHLKAFEYSAPQCSVVVVNSGGRSVLVRSVVFTCPVLNIVRELSINEHLAPDSHIKPIFDQRMTEARLVMNDVSVDDLKLLQKHHRFCTCSFNPFYFDDSHDRITECTPTDEPVPLRIPATATVTYHSYSDNKDYEEKANGFMMLAQVEVDGKFADYLTEAQNLRNADPGIEKSTPELAPEL